MEFLIVFSLFYVYAGCFRCNAQTSTTIPEGSCATNDEGCFSYTFSSIKDFSRQLKSDTVLREYLRQRVEHEMQQEAKSEEKPLCQDNSQTTANSVTQEISNPVTEQSATTAESLYISTENDNEATSRFTQAQPAFTAEVSDTKTGPFTSFEFTTSKSFSKDADKETDGMTSSQTHATSTGEVFNAATEQPTMSTTSRTVSKTTDNFTKGTTPTQNYAEFTKEVSTDATEQSTTTIALPTTSNDFVTQGISDPVTEQSVTTIDSLYISTENNNEATSRFTQAQSAVTAEVSDANTGSSASSEFTTSGSFSKVTGKSKEDITTPRTHTASTHKAPATTRELFATTRLFTSMEISEDTDKETDGMTSSQTQATYTATEFNIATEQPTMFTTLRTVSEISIEATDQVSTDKVAKSLTGTSSDSSFPVATDKATTEFETSQTYPTSNEKVSEATTEKPTKDTTNIGAVSVAVTMETTIPAKNLCVSNGFPVAVTMKAEEICVSFGSDMTNWDKANGSCFYFINFWKKRATYEEAKSNCTEMGGRLAEKGIHDGTIATYLCSFKSVFRKKKIKFLIGLQRSNAIWEWSDNATYSDDTTSRTHDCVLIKWGNSTLGIVFHRCTEPKRYICEK